MLPYATIVEAEAALGRSLSFSEAVWFRYSARMPDCLLYYHSIIFVFVNFTLAGVLFALLEFRLPASISPYKIQPKVRHSPAYFFQCYKDVVRAVAFSLVLFQLASYPIVKFVGIRMGLPLPSFWEATLQILVYFLIEDYLNYWIHRRLMHSKWGYDKIHRVHHEITAPFGFAALHAHWADLLLAGIAAFAGPAFVPCHIIVFWIWGSLRQLGSVEVHSGYDFPWSPTKFIPFYGGVGHHDYHHYVGQHSQSNFAGLLSHCDYIYGTDKGYRYHKALLAKLKETSSKYNEEEQTND